MSPAPLMSDGANVVSVSKMPAISVGPPEPGTEAGHQRERLEVEDPAQSITAAARVAGGKLDADRLKACQIGAGPVADAIAHVIDLGRGLSCGEFLERAEHPHDHAPAGARIVRKGDPPATRLRGSAGEIGKRE